MVLNLRFEMQTMQEISLNYYTTLYDFLLMNENRAAYYVYNDRLYEIFKINNFNFENEFANYGFILNLQMIKGQYRKSMLDISLNVLQSIINLPVMCILIILSFMSNEDLIKLANN